ncbi:uncharacterized protein LOC126261740 [Schistocerca nitens]|uniref:uncharacterized protein LOC126261740 n=1 Tax=Schistocerca nitens TaxID=7011 RepID=UPI002118862D|nr:uncharacterized protein LOC126261740 [Schistocerca nitens]
MNQIRQPFLLGGTRASKSVEVVHSDLYGPMEIISVGKFQEYQKTVENQQERKIKTVRTDNGKEFCCVNFDSLLKKHAILHQLSNSYTPEQNGLAERLNRTVVEKIGSGHGAYSQIQENKLDKQVKEMILVRYSNTTKAIDYMTLKQIISSYLRDKKCVTQEDEVKSIRRSQRQLKPNKRIDGDEIYFSAGTSDQVEDPTTMQEGLSRPDAEEWKRAMGEEIQTFKDNNACGEVNLPESASIVQFKWAFSQQ